MNISTRYFAVAAAVLYFIVVAFQIALAAGAPWGRAAYGGAVEQPGIELRISSAISVLIWTSAALIVLKRAGFRLWAPLPKRALPAAVWVLAGISIVAIVANAITPSEIERAIWLPHTILMAIATFGLAISAKRSRQVAGRA